MPRTARASRGGYVYHVLNRGNARQDVFHKPEDFAAFVQLMSEASERLPMRLVGYGNDKWRHQAAKEKKSTVRNRFIAAAGQSGYPSAMRGSLRKEQDNRSTCPFFLFSSPENIESNW